MITAILSCWALLLGLSLLMLGNGLQGTLLGLRASLEGFPTVAILVHALYVLPVPWFAMRVITGFCFAGLYLITESWLNDIATNENRGQLLSVYMVVVMGGMGLGQLLLNQASPLGIVGSFATGLAQGSVFGMGAVFANGAGLTVIQVSWFMTAFAVGGMLLQWPIGRLSDAMDRRKVIVVTTALAALSAVGAALALDHSVLILVTVMGIYGGISVPLYSLFIAHTNDHLEPRHRVAASAGLIMVGGLGSVLGPVLMGSGMNALGSVAFPLFLGIIHALVTAYGLWRMTQRESVPLEDQEHYPPLAPRTTSLAASIATAAAAEEAHDDVPPWDEI